MFFASEKEYEILKAEVNIVKDSITKYVGYIIGLATASSIITKYFSDGFTGRYYPILFILITMIIITLIFELVWYKFQSHNKYIGYLQLISQEIGHYNLDDLDFTDKRYLDNHLNCKTINKSTFGDINIYGWDFIRSRFSNAVLHDSKVQLLKSTDKSKFIFKIPQDTKYADLKNEYKDLDNSFFNNIIHPLYHDLGKNKTLKLKLKKLVSGLIDYLFIIKYVFSVNSLDFLARKKRIDKKYINTSWNYPVKITQVAIVAVLLLYIAIIFLLSMSYSFQLSFHFENIFPFIIGLTSTLIFIFWVHKYWRGLYDLLAGNKSIDYFCWSFFVFRVQLLNSHKVVPKYFSRSFIRFFKSRIILAEIESNKDEFLTDNIGDCCQCNSKIQINITTSRICNNCLKHYTHILKIHRELSDQFRLRTHMLIKEKIRLRLNER